MVAVVCPTVVVGAHHLRQQARDVGVHQGGLVAGGAVGEKHLEARHRHRGVGDEAPHEGRLARNMAQRSTGPRRKGTEEENQRR